MTHQLTGVGLAAVTSAGLDVPASTTGVLLGAAWLGSMLPDADLAGARIYRRTSWERHSLSLRMLATLARLPLRLLVLLPHRGLTHSVFACALASAIAGVLVSFAAPALAVAAAGGIAIGYLAHLAADACTPAGIAMWAPISRRRRWLLPAPARIRTGSLRELIVAIALTAALAATTALLAG